MGDNKINVGAQVNLPTGGGNGQGQGAANGVGVGPKNLPQGDGGTPEYGPVNERGNGNANGLRGRGNLDGQNNMTDIPSRVRENESRAQQIRSRIENIEPKSNRLGDDAPGRDRSFEGGRVRGDDDGNSRRNDGVQLRSYVGDDRARAQTDDGRPRTTFNDQRGLFEQSNSPGRSEFGHSHNNSQGGQNNSPLSNAPNALGLGTTHGNSHSNDGRLGSAAADLVGSAGRLVDGVTHGNGHGHAYGVESHRLFDSAVNSAASRLDHITSSGGRPTRDALAAALGLDAGDKTVDKVFKLLDHALRHVNHDAGRANQVDTLFTHVRGDDNGQHNSVGRGAEQLAREVVKDLASALQLGQHLNHLEKTGGSVVRQAEAAIARALYDAARVEQPLANRPALGGEPRSLPTPQSFPVERPTPQEVLRDLRAGAFIPAQERYSPFPLTGRARVAAEMMELMRTLDAVEGALRRASEGVDAQRSFADSAVAAWLRAKAGIAAPENVLDELALLLTPSLPGRAARSLIPAHVAAMNGLLTDADGRALLARDGMPLKLERLLWLSAAGGLLGSAFKGENSAARLSPALLYGFDAIYSVIGFDGRTLAAPHFVAVQAAANESESEWIFGQQPLTLGWARELIERLKDSIAVEHNLLGETLEEALADGRFHVALLSVEVNEGAPDPDTSAVRSLLPGASAALA
ncbi:MAG TPA: hypothetical protein VGP08_04585 [Pyrinomonadaceae bacterium]|jgi:hypothetical protein|nr:hypothetical protein [Pyrinomonadaceae bacterium]